MPGVADAGGSSGEGRLHTNYSHTNNVRHTIAAERDACSEAKHPLSLYRSPKANPTVRGAPQSKIATSILENSPTQSPPLSKRRAVVGGGALALLWYAAIRKKPRGPLRSPFPSAPFTVEPRDWTLSSPGLPPRVRPFATRVVSCWDFSPDPDRKSRTGNQKPGGTHTRTHTNMERK
jgi:hypothetical protein